MASAPRPIAEGWAAQWSVELLPTGIGQRDALV